MIDFSVGWLSITIDELAESHIISAQCNALGLKCVFVFVLRPVL